MKKPPLQSTQEQLFTMLRNARTIDWFDRYINATRDFETTDYLIDLCRKDKVTLVCRSQDQAEEIHTDHKIFTTYINAPVLGERSVVDNMAIAQLMREAQQISRVCDQLLGILKQKGIY